MNKKINKYLNEIFAPLKQTTIITDLKEELAMDLEEKLDDYLEQLKNI